MLVELALLDVLIQLDIISLPQYRQDFVINFSHALIWVFDELEDLHEDVALIEDPFETHWMEDERVDSIQALAKELGVILFAHEQG